MNPDDPFASDSDRTVIVPSPGRRASVPQHDAAQAPVEPPAALFEIGLNPLLAAANPLLNMVPQLRATLQHPDPSGLRDAVAQNIRQFETRAKTAGVAAEKVLAARYALCTLLDEAAANTPWGGSGLWAKQSLLIMFHNEAWGGEKFFQLLNKLAENPGGNRDLLQLLYVCLALGFEGRYRVVPNGRQQLEALRERLAQILRNQGSGYERDLSPHWQGFTTKSAPVYGSLRVWIVASVCSALLLVVYMTANLALNRASDPVFTAIQAIGVQAAVPRQAPAANPRLATFLKPEIDAGLVELRDEELRSVITLRGDGLFEPGSAIIPDKARPLLRRIAEALGAVRGNVLVTGHTDSQPIRSVRFPSNWHLSQERARSVTEFLRTTLPSTPLTAEGRADAEPIAPNDTPANRSKNRRVEITLFVARAG